MSQGGGQAPRGRVAYEVRGEIAWVKLDRPEKLNALDKSMWLGLSEAVRRASADGRVKCLVITGSGRAFSSGDDIREMIRLSSVEEADEFFSKYVANAVDALLACEKPVVFAVNGLAYGGGMELLLLGDVVVASESAVLSVPEVKIGLIPPLMLSVGVAVLGLRKAAYLSLTAKEMTAEEAARMGLVDLVVRPEELEVKATEVCELLRRMPPEAVRSIKRLLNSWRRMMLSPAVFSELTRLVLTGGAKDRMERFLRRERV